MRNQHNGRTVIHGMCGGMIHLASELYNFFVFLRVPGRNRTGGVELIKIVEKQKKIVGVCIRWINR